MIERRYTETRVSQTESRIAGLASPVYDGSPGTQYQLWEGAVERFAPGAFDAYLNTSPDVVALFNHDSNLVLGRTPDTLKLRSDSAGLHYEVELPDTTVARDLKVSIQRGDVRGSSFAFVPTDVEWQQDGDQDVRLIRGAKLFDVSPVTSPAYGGSSVGLRSNEERQTLKKERDEYRARLDTERRLKIIDNLTR